MKSVSQAEEVFQLASKDLISFGKLFLPDDFLRSETPAFHYEMADAIDDEECKQLAIILPRGHGKTVLTKASILKDFLFCPSDDMHFYAWVAATQKLSVGNMDYIKHHLEFNESINWHSFPINDKIVLIFVRIIIVSSFPVFNLVSCE